MEIVVELAFVNELRVLSIHGLHLYCDFEVGFCVYSLKDFPKSALVNFPDDFEVLPYLLKHLWHCLN
jgi:hypothetical protein